MRIAIYGAGGVGGYFGGRLAEAGHSVAFVARGAHLAAIRRAGLRVESLAGDFTVNPAEATDSAADLGPVEAVLVCVKAWQVRDAGAALAPLLGPGTFVVPLENGVEAADDLGATIGPQRVLPGLCRILSYIAAPGVIRHAGVAPSVEFGEPDGSVSERAESLLAAFATARGVTAKASSDIAAAIWEKFLFIAPYSGVGARTGLAASGMRSDPAVRALLEDAMREVEAVARARGVRIRADIVERTMSWLDNLPADGTASMQRDLQEGRPSELEYQTGAVVRLARQAGVPAPVHEQLLAALRPLEERARLNAAGR